MSLRKANVYEDNYGYTMNMYQPMIDYIDAKNRGDNPKYPHMPWSEERGFNEFRSNKLVRTYSNEDIKNYANKTSHQAKKDLLDQRIMKRSAFSVKKTASTARVTKHLNDENIVERTTKKIRSREDELRKSQEMADHELQRLLKEFQDDRKEVILSPSLKCAIRGKTANQIRDALLAESRKNIRCGTPSESSEYKYHETMRNQRASSEHRVVHVTLMDNRDTRQLDSTVTHSLDQVKRDLKSFNSRTTTIFDESRFV